MKRFEWVAVLLGALAFGGPLPAADPVTTNVAKPSAFVTNAEPKLFVFGGGDFNQFMTSLRDEFGKEVYELIQIRGDPDRIHVPKMRIHGAMGRGVTDVREVLNTYNRVSQEGNGFLGKWIFTPSQFFYNDIRLHPDTIVFMGPTGSGADGTGGIQVRAFSIRGLSPDSIKAFEQLIRDESSQLRQEIAQRSGDISSAEGNVRVHRGTGLLIASGGKTYVELVSTLMDAFVTKELLLHDALKDAVQEKNQAPGPQANPKVAKPQ
jgi:hypothetical protein